MDGDDPVLRRRRRRQGIQIHPGGQYPAVVVVGVVPPDLGPARGTEQGRLPGGEFLGKTAQKAGVTLPLLRHLTAVEALQSLIPLSPPYFRCHLINLLHGHRPPCNGPPEGSAGSRRRIRR